MIVRDEAPKKEFQSIKRANISEKKTIVFHLPLFGKDLNKLLNSGRPALKNFRNLAVYLNPEHE